MPNVSLSIDFILTSYRTELKEIYEQREIDSIIEIVFAHLLQYSRLQIFSQRKEILSGEISGVLMEYLKLLKTNMPVQYITGNTEFYGCSIDVSPDVLIPRQETAELVQWIISETGNEKLRILDIGTGSGNIAIALAVNLSSARVTACDISENAIAMAARNALKNKAEVTFSRYDILTGTGNLPETGWDIIVSNPPYIRLSEKKLMKKNVLAFEPHSTLFVPDDDALLFYRHIADFAVKSLAVNGRVFFEVNEYLAGEVVKLMKDNYFNFAVLRTDINGRNRMVKVWN
ncbi:MAG: peptide chain release factor N(5)-glutamine methyltransferase [Bacteroidia bacterium]|nr:peptide chain release factor N(5)-glutamine methyltransferase [Bacteroidia bacterium]